MNRRGIFKIPEPRLEPPDLFRKITCSRCGRVISETETYGEFREETICSDCAEVEFLRLTTRERVAIILEGMGYDVMED